MANNLTTTLFDIFEKKHNQSPSSINNPIEYSKMWAEVLDQTLPSLFSKKQDNSDKLDEAFKSFTVNIIPELKAVINSKLTANGNVYEMFDAPSLSSANAITRQFNTKLGLFWEKVASLSSNVISPELHLGFKIPGVDVIVYYDNKLYYTQLKTQKNTLTGAQSGRVNEELGVFEHAWFVACINNNASWTYSGNKITKLIGNDFWSKTDINYEKIISNLEKTILAIEALLN